MPPAVSETALVAMTRTGVWGSIAVRVSTVVIHSRRNIFGCFRVRSEYNTQHCTIRSRTGVSNNTDRER